MNNISLSGLHIDVRDLGKDTLVIKASPYYAYEEDKRTDKIEGYKYTTVFPDRNFAQLDIKVPGDKMMDVPANQYVAAKFEGLEVKVYYDRENRARLTARAKSVRPAATDKAAT